MGFFDSEQIKSCLATNLLEINDTSFSPLILLYLLILLNFFSRDLHDDHVMMANVIVRIKSLK